MKLIFQKHGNLEILCGCYSWSSDTCAGNIDVLYFNSKGQLWILNKNKSVAKELMQFFQRTHGADKLILQDERNLALYDYNSHLLWVTSTNGKFIETKNAILFEELSCTLFWKLDKKSIFSPINILYLKEVIQKRN